LGKAALRELIYNSVGVFHSLAMTEDTTNQTDACPACAGDHEQGDQCARSETTAAEQTIPVMAEVRVQETVYPIATKWLRIGRELDNDIVVRADGFVSRYHAWITFEREHYWIEDLGSTNGTMLNGEPLERRELLASDDKIKIGESELTFVLLEKTGSAS
jgi:pSer/pThr/pTyr-binding forkhead associated (FHA) protein